MLTIYSPILLVSDSSFFSNSHTFGGAIFFQGNSELTISRSNFNGNNASYGGSIFAQHPEPRGMSINIIDSNFSQNTAVTVETSELGVLFGGYGGALCLNFSGHFDQMNCSILRNNFTENTAEALPGCPSGFGGAIYFSYVGSLSLVNNAFSSNEATKSGGGIYFIGGSLFYSRGNKFSENLAESGKGGALAIENTNYIDENNTYTGN